MRKDRYKKYFVKQVLESDCGPACLSMIAKYYGKNIPIEKIKIIAKTDQFGTCGKGMMIATKKIGLFGKSFLIQNAEELEEMYEEQRKPFIAVMNTTNIHKHYVVVFSMDKQTIVVGDPTSDIKYLTISDFMEFFTGIVLCLKETDKFQSALSNDNINIFKEIFHYNSRYFFIISFISLTIAIFGIVNSVYYKYLMDNFNSADYYIDLTKITLYVILIICVKHLLDYLRQFLLLNLSKKIDIPLMNKLYLQVMNLPYSFYSNRITGDIISRFDDVNLVRDSLTNVFVNLFLDTALCLTGFYFLYSINPSLFKICIIPLLTNYIISSYFKKRTGDSNMALLSLTGLHKDKLNQSINGFEKIKCFGLQNKMTRDLTETFNNLVNHSIGLGNLINLQLTLLQLVNQLFSISILFLGAKFVIDGKMTMGDLITFNSLLYYFMTPITHFFSLLPNIRLATAANKRIVDLLSAEKESLNEGIQIVKDNSFPLIEISNLNYTYDYRNDVLRSLSLTIEENNTIGIVGPSGSGKTTLVNLLLRFDEPTLGYINIYGNNINRISKKELRKTIVCINQFTFFFKDTIRNNLLIGNPSATDEEIIDILKMVDIYDLIEKLPNKLDSMLMENANNLSGGQRQKLAIAQALISKPKILIFDESTSNLDSMSESIIKKIISSLKDMTVIVVTHRLNLIKNCNEIFVLEGGTITEHGTHDLLLNQGHTYYRFWMEQQ